ncbi:CRISPR-associated protein Csn2 [Oribacterium sp. KHPX15]|uniref:type II-A CRISPR-associated protein Csn2 n=1 Tax=Oribacterium sp. KHPX15 TaxID=1855342 RepID=UPI00089BB350|nr:type II-A CRISPR-associated protein Csn2 [Oribacterium sp. KHPX15]SDZ88730.1 CRISPR-associated protein Csn2 [Oribacterium sp. KHPX15]
MKFFCDKYNLEYDFEENKVTVLTIDSSAHFRDFISRLWNQFNNAEDFLIVSNNGKEISLNKVADIISDPFSINLNNKKILSKIYHDIIQDIQENDLEDFLKMKLEVEQFIINICEKSDFNLSYEPKLEYSDLLKLYDVHIDVDDMELATKIINYIHLAHRVLNTSLFIFINLKSYFSNKDLELLYQTLLYEKINILVIERYDYLKLHFEKHLIIDNDACVIYD